MCSILPSIDDSALRARYDPSSYCCVGVHELCEQNCDRSTPTYHIAMLKTKQTTQCHTVPSYGMRQAQQRSHASNPDTLIYRQASNQGTNPLMHYTSIPTFTHHEVYPRVLDPHGRRRDLDDRAPTSDNRDGVPFFPVDDRLAAVFAICVSARARSCPRLGQCR